MKGFRRRVLPDEEVGVFSEKVDGVFLLFEESFRVRFVRVGDESVDGEERCLCLGGVVCFPVEEMCRGVGVFRVAPDVKIREGVGFDDAEGVPVVTADPGEGDRFGGVVVFPVSVVFIAQRVLQKVRCVVWVAPYLLRIIAHVGADRCGVVSGPGFKTWVRSVW